MVGRHRLQLERHHVRGVAKLIDSRLVGARPVPVALHRVLIDRGALWMVLCNRTHAHKAKLFVKRDGGHRRLQHDEIVLAARAQLLEGQAHEQLARAQPSE